MLMKGYAAGKSRLAPRLSAAQRRSLIDAMACHVVGVMRAQRSLAGIAMLSPDSEVLSWARDSGLLALLDSGGGLNDVLPDAARTLEAIGAERMLVVPADLPHLAIDDVATLLAHHEANAVVVVPADRHGGTNGLLLTPPTATTFCFGTESARRHLRAAGQRGRAAHLLRLPSFACDVDEPDDLDGLPAQLSIADSVLAS
jgi:2-phospho-L-lactate guanylyltransferase